MGVQVSQGFRLNPRKSNIFGVTFDHFYLQASCIISKNWLEPETKPTSQVKLVQIGDTQGIMMANYINKMKSAEPKISIYK